VSQVLVAGVDCSTQATKVVVVDADTGAVVAQGRSAHEVTGGGGARETHPDVWWSALGAALAQTGRAGDIRALSIGGQQHGLVALGADGRPVRPAVLWNDTRSAPDAAALVDDLGGPQAWAEQIGTVPVASLTVTSWAWLRRTEPDVAARVTAVRLPHDDVSSRLVGRSVTDRGDASGTGWWSTATEGYATDVLGLERVQLDAAVLPTVLGPDEAAGTVRPDAAGELGLGSDVLVGPGTGDNMAAALGLGLVPGQAAMSLGTSGTLYATTPQRTADASGVVAGFADATGDFLPLAATLNATLAADRVAEWLGIDREDVEPAGEVVVMPFLDGERTPDLPHAAGSVVGLRHGTTRGQILQATYDGVVVSLLDALDRIDHLAGGLTDAPLLLLGGGARGSVWRETVRRLSGRPLAVPSVDEAVARGAAAQAAAVLAGTHPREVVASWNDGPAAPAIETLEAVARDEETLERHRRVRDLAEDLNRDG
jgi:xylulokinase